MLLYQKYDWHENEHSTAIWYNCIIAVDMISAGQKVINGDVKEISMWTNTLVNRYEYMIYIWFIYIEWLHQHHSVGMGSWSYSESIPEN